MEGMGVTHMAQSERFYFWRGYWEALATLPTDAQRGRFVMAICQFAFADEMPDLSDDPVLAFAWMIVRDQVAESVDIGRKQSERGSRGGRPRKTTAKTTAKSGAKTTAKSGAESGAESVRYGSVPSGYAPSLTAPALAAESREPPAPRDPEEDLRAAHAVLAAMEAIEAEERRARGGDG